MQCSLKALGNFLDSRTGLSYISRPSEQTIGNGDKKLKSIKKWCFVEGQCALPIKRKESNSEC